MKKGPYFSFKIILYKKYKSASSLLTVYKYTSLHIYFTIISSGGFRRSGGIQKDSEKLGGINKWFCCFLAWLTLYVLLPRKSFINELIIVEKNWMIKFPALEFGGFLQWIGIWMLIPAQTGWCIFVTTCRLFLWVLKFNLFILED